MKTGMLIFILFFVVVQADADVENTFYHPAAAAYIEGDIAYASNQVMRGLEREPTQVKLLKLKELLEQQDDASSDRSSEQDKDTSDNEPSDQQEEESSSEQENVSSDGESPEDNTPEDATEQQSNRSPAAPTLTEPMTPDEAEQLLDALRDDEQDERRKLRPIMGRPIDVEKDW